MKGYGLISLIVALLMMILPLPMLSVSKEDSPSPVIEPDSSVAEVPEPAPAEENYFRIQVGDNVEQLGEREFLIRTLAFEMPALYEPEALKAQAVAAYTYYSRQRNLHRGTDNYDFVTPDSSFPGQFTTEALKNRWGSDFDAFYTKITQAVDSIFGKTIRYNGELIDACYFAISSGKTENASVIWSHDLPYLQSVDSSFDATAKGYESVVSHSPEEVKTALQSAVPSLSLDGDPALWLSNPRYSPAGTLTEITVGGTAMKGTQIRTALGLRSACITVSYQDGNFVFTVHGYGHGVGMSQNGAQQLALQGYTYDAILKHYYTGVNIE